MTEYIKMYTPVGSPTVNSDFIATELKGRSSATDAYIVSGFCNFNDPFELEFSVIDRHYISNWTGSLLKSYSNPYTEKEFFDIYYSGSNRIIANLQNVGEIRLDLDNSKTVSIINLKWDGQTYSLYAKYSDGSVSDTTTYDSTQNVISSYLAIGLDQRFTLDTDLKAFKFKNLNSDNEVKLVYEIPELSEHGTTKAKLEYLEETKKLISEALTYKGITTNGEDPFRQFAELIIDGIQILPRMQVTDNCNKIEISNSAFFPVYITSNNDSYKIKCTSRFKLYNTLLSNSNKITIEIDGGTRYSTSGTVKYRNSIFTIYRSGNYIYIEPNKKSSRNIDPSLGYFITDSNGGLVKNIPYYDSKYAYKADQVPENFVTYDQVNDSFTIKAGTYESAPSQLKGARIFELENDIILLYDAASSTDTIKYYKSEDNLYTYYFSLSDNVPCSYHFGVNTASSGLLRFGSNIGTAYSPSGYYININSNKQIESITKKPIYKVL